MRYISLLIVVLTVIAATEIRAQDEIGSVLTFSLGARGLALGQAAVATAEGPSALLTNSAAIGGYSGYGATIGYGSSLPTTTDESTLQGAVAGTLLPGTLSLGASYIKSNLDGMGWYLRNSLARIHAAYRPMENLSVGVSLNSYRYEASYVRRDEGNNVLGTIDDDVTAFDFGLSARYELRSVAFGDDALQIGLDIENLIDTKVKLEHRIEFPAEVEVRKPQYLRFGAAWSIPLAPNEGGSLNPTLIVGSGITAARDYFLYKDTTSYPLYPGVTLALRLWDMVTVSWNREEETNAFSAIPSYPMQRLGIMADLPIGEWLKLSYPVMLSVDYCYWTELGDTSIISSLRRNDDWNRNVLAVGISVLR
ncbi:MAG: hypothetical protein IH600_07695 [Bacteroidetes bacterium]|nr:hypothetical protein [Bacteroidota bacterium]